MTPHPFLVVAGRRVGLSVPLIVVVTGLVFVLMSFVPGDAVQAILGPKFQNRVPPSAYAGLRKQLGLDKPLPVQYWHWFSHAIRGNLGVSVVTNQSVSQAIGQRYSVTLSLVVGALAVSVIVGVALGLASAVLGGRLGRAVDAFAMFGWVVPVYWLGAELAVVFAVKLGWLPAIGYVTFAQSATGWLKSLILPVVALSIAPIGGFAKFTRAGMLEALTSEYVRMAKARGVPSWSIVLRHAFKTAALQVVTLAGLLTVALLIGTVFVEQLFALPGLGSLMIGSVTNHDLTMVEGVAAFFTVIVVCVNVIVDLCYALLNPQVRST